MKILLTDCDHANLEQENAVFQENNLEFHREQCKTEDDLIEKAKGYGICMNQYAPFTRKVLEKLAPDLKLVVRYGVGVNNVDLEAATEFGVKICNVPDYGMNEVADQAVAFMMALTRKLAFMNHYTKEKDWDYTKAIPIYRLQEQTVGIFGMGRIGRTFAQRMSGFGMRRIGCDICYKTGDIVDGVEMVDFETLLRESDILSIHSPLDDSTRNVFNLENMKKMKKTSYLVNVSRGGIINESDLYTILKEKHIAGAGIDVVAEEPMKPGAELFSLDNFLCTPHIAWYSEQSAKELKTKVAVQACKFAKGQELDYWVNKF